MKYLSGLFGTFNKRYSFLLLENNEDLIAYTYIDKIVKSKQAISFWMDLKSQDFRKTPNDYLAHEVSENSIARVLSLNMEIKRTTTSIIDFCLDTDSIIFELHERLDEYINVLHKNVRINELGGICTIDNNFSEYDVVKDIDEKQMLNFILSKNIDFDFNIKGKSIVIENDNINPKSLIKLFVNKTSIKDIQIFQGFKMKTILFNEKDFFKFFKEGLIQGLENIIFETTGQDVNQINLLKQILEQIMVSFPEKEITIFVKTYSSDKELFSSKLKNINIIKL